MTTFFKVFIFYVANKHTLGPCGNCDAIQLRLEVENNGGYFWRMRLNGTVEDLPGNEESSSNFILFVFVDRSLPRTLNIIYGYGIIGLYTTFVLVLSRFVRNFFHGIHEDIMFNELPNAEKVIQLCYDIYMVRELQEWDLEESLFAKLIFLYRSPETMIKWSRHPNMQGIQVSNTN